VRSGKRDKVDDICKLLTEELGRYKLRGAAASEVNQNLRGPSKKGKKDENTKLIKETSRLVRKYGGDNLENQKETRGKFRSGGDRKTSRKEKRSVIPP